MDLSELFDTCGEGGIRTHEELSPLVVFRTTALDHYATSPDKLLFYQSFPDLRPFCSGGKLHP